MIEHQIVNGRPATVAYLNNKFEFVEKDQAQLVKVIFDDSVLFLVPEEKK